MKKNIHRRLCATGFLLALIPVSIPAADLPKGLILNLDLRQIEDGLIPNKTLYPLHVPQGDLSTKSDGRRTFLILEEGQHLDVPHSLLLDSGGGEWVATIRVFARTEGLIMSQGNDEVGYAIYLQNGAIRVAVKTGASTNALMERLDYGITPALNRWVTIEIRFKSDEVSLLLNRARVASVPLAEPLQGENLQIRIGEHQTLPIALQHLPGITPSGFTGAISSLKFLRQ